MALNLEKIDVYEFLSELGMNNVRDEGKDIWYSCFSDQHYRGDANPSASMEQGTTRFHCFSCGMSGNAVTFLAELEDVSPIQAAIWINERFGGTKIVSKEDLVQSVSNILNSTPKAKSDGTPTVISETEADRRLLKWDDLYKKYRNYKSGYLDELPGETWEDIFTLNPEYNPQWYMFDRGFTVDTLSNWKIGWDVISERFSIPVRNDKGQLVGFKARSYNKDPKYLVLGGPEYGFEPYETRKIIFGIDRAIDSNKYHLENYRIIVREGELNAIRLTELGFGNSVGISGKFLSDEQSDLLKKYAEEIILWFDDVEDAIKASEKLRTIKTTYIIPSYSKDPMEMERDEILSILDQRQSALL